MKHRAFLQTHLQRTIIANSLDLCLARAAATFVDAENLVAALTNIIYFHDLAPSSVFYNLPRRKGNLYIYV